jgi:hypothetical protein
MWTRHCNTDVVRGEFSSMRVVVREAVNEEEEDDGKTPDEESVREDERVRELDKGMVLDESVEGRMDDDDEVVMVLEHAGRTKSV